MTKFTHNDLSERDEVTITGCNGKWTVKNVLDGYNGVCVIPEDGNAPEGVYIDVSEVTAIVSKYDEVADRDRTAKFAYHEAFADALKAGKTIELAQKEADAASDNVYGSWEI